MATSSKKSSAKRATAAKKAARTTRSSAKKSTRPPVKSAKRAATAPGKTTAKKTSARKDLPSRNPPVPHQWLTGALTISDGALGVATKTGFVSLDKLAAAGENVEFVFALSPQRSGDLQQTFKSLLAFIEEHAGDSITGVVRCCVS